MALHQLSFALRVLTWMGALLVIALPPLTGTGGLLLRGEPSSFDEVVVLLIAMPPFLTVAWGLLQLSGFYRRLAMKEHFTRSAAMPLRRFGWSLVAAAALLPFTRGLAIMYQLAPDGGAGWAATYWRAGPLISSALGVIIGVIVIVFARILDQATELAEENASFL